MKRIALLLEYGTLNGGERSMLAVLQRVRQEGIEVIAIAPPDGLLATELRRQGVEVHEFSVRDDQGKRRPREEILADLRQHVEQLGVDLLHANSLSMGRLTGLLAAELSVPTTAHLRDILSLSKAKIGDLNRNRRLIAVSQATKAYHAAQGLNTEIIDVIHNGVDSRQFAPRSSSKRLQRELGLAAECHFAVTIGQIGLRKAQDVLIEAVGRVRDDLPNWHFAIIGERNSGKDESRRFEADLLRRVEELNLTGRVHWLGYRLDVDRLFDDVDLLIHPARQEPLGRVLLEAAAAGVPILATDVGGTGEIVRHGEEAWLVSADEPALLAEGIKRLADDRSLRETFADRARARAVKHFSVEQAAERLVAVWRQL